MRQFQVAICQRPIYLQKASYLECASSLLSSILLLLVLVLPPELLDPEEGEELEELDDELLDELLAGAKLPEECCS